MGEAESDCVGCVAATSRKAREVAHPQLFRSMLQRQTRRYTSTLSGPPAVGDERLEHEEILARL
jgi:hypothetical protein